MWPNPPTGIVSLGRVVIKLLQGQPLLIGASSDVMAQEIKGETLSGTGKPIAFVSCVHFLSSPLKVAG